MPRTAGHLSSEYIMHQFITELPWAIVGSAGFALLFGLRANKILYAAAGGGIGWAVYLLCELFLTRDILICSLIAAAVGTAYAELLARLLRTPATVILIPTVIPLVPGGSLYYTMSSLIASDRVATAAYGMATVKCAVGIAAGITAVTLVSKPLKRRNPNDKG